MIDWTLIKESFTRSLPNTILLIIAFAIMNGKLNKILVNEGIRDTKIEQLMNENKDHKTISRRLSIVEQRIAAHIGEAYIRQEDDDE